MHSKHSSLFVLFLVVAFLFAVGGLFLDYGLREDLSLTGFSFTGKVTDDDIDDSCFNEKCRAEETCEEGYTCYRCADV